MPKYKSHAAEKAIIYTAVNDYITGNKSQQECCEEYGISQSIFNYYYNKTKNGTATFTVPVMPVPVEPVHNNVPIRQQIPVQPLPKKNKVDTWVEEVLKSADQQPKKETEIKKEDNKTKSKPVDNNKKQYKKIDYKDYLTDYKSIVK